MASLFKTLSCGVYVVGVAHKERRNAFTAAWVAQLSYRPLLLGLSVNPRNFSYRLIKTGRVFALSVLAQEQVDLAHRFGTRSGRAEDKLAASSWRTAQTGAPVLNEALAYFDCRLHFTRRAGDHVLVVGQVIDGALLRTDARPLIYAQTGELDGAETLYTTRFQAFD